RTLSRIVMAEQGRRPSIRTFQPGEVLMTQGEPARSMDLLLDGMVEVQVDGEVVAECGPGSVLGERAFVEGGTRTSTVTARTLVKAVQADPSSFTADELAELRTLHLREYDRD
ncbi:MAG: cyclic nucleotide-binding domain-containing protein, partial [Actinomycetota bacterium]